MNALQQAFKQLAAENRKLHTNNRDANRQATLLAQEVDERHALLENSAKAKVNDSIHCQDCLLKMYLL